MFFENGSFIWLAALPVLSLIVLLLAFRKNKKTAALLMNTGLQQRNKNTNQYQKEYSIRKIIEITLMTIVLILAVFSALRPVSDPTLQEINKEGSDIILLVDVSKSMLAEDLIPSRMKRVKIELTRLLENADGDRIGLIVFSGSPVLKSPLTIDYGYLRSVIDDLSVQSVSRGGTELSRALSYTIETGFDEMAGSGRDIILITDGETHDSGAVEIAKKAGEEGIGLTIIGLGDPVRGAKIPVESNRNEIEENPIKQVGEDPALQETQKKYLEYNGKPVLTKLNETLLKDMAKASGGDFLSVSEGSFDLSEIFNRISAKRANKSTGSMKITVYKQRYRFFLLIAVILLVFLSLFEFFFSNILILFKSHFPSPERRDNRV